MFPYWNFCCESSMMFLMGNIASASDFGAAVRARRRELGLTQEALALEASVGRRFVIELEAGKSTASLGLALRCAQLLGLDVRMVPRGGDG